MFLQVFEEFVRTLPLNKLPASFNVSGTDATKDKLGRPIAEHVQIFCITKYRRLSMCVRLPLARLSCAAVKASNACAAAAVTRVLLLQ